MQQSTLTTRRIVIAGILAGVSILLGATRLGFIPVPTAAGNATIMHLPAIVGAVLEGPLVGAIIGTIFGIFSFLQATVPLFKDPLVAILPRIFIGVTAYYAYAWTRKYNEYFALGLAGFIGSATNTILVLGMAVIRNFFTVGTAASVAVVNGTPEAVVAIIITIAVVAAWKRLDTGARRSKVAGD